MVVVRMDGDSALTNEQKLQGMLFAIEQGIRNIIPGTCSDACAVRATFDKHMCEIDWRYRKSAPARTSPCDSDLDHFARGGTSLFRVRCRL